MAKGSVVGLQVMIPGSAKMVVYFLSCGAVLCRPPINLLLDRSSDCQCVAYDNDCSKHYYYYY